MQLGSSALRRRRTSSLAVYLTSAAFIITMAFREAHRASPVAYSASPPCPCHTQGSYLAIKNDPASTPRRPLAVESAAFRLSTFFHASDAEAAHRPSRPAPWPPPPPWPGPRLPTSQLWGSARATTHFNGSPAALSSHERPAEAWYSLQHPSVPPALHNTARVVSPGTNHHLLDMPSCTRYLVFLLLLSHYRGVNPSSSYS
jgi:hypothetical protein